MQEFKRPEITDKEWIDEILMPDDLRNADLCFTNIFLWADGINTLISRVDKRVIIKSGTGDDIIYTFPAGHGELKPAIDAILEDAAQNGLKARIRGLPPIYLCKLRELYPSEFELKPETNSFDYVYLAKLLAEPSGKKLHAKKNHINRFIAENDWSYEAITLENLDDCRAMAAGWQRGNGEKIASSYLDEDSALEKMFKYYDRLDLEGGILRAGGKIVAFTVGEVLSSDTFVTHFEKAYADINGAYPMINREFARQILRDHPEIAYINREEDMGLDYLRRAKQSYYPEFMVDKYMAVWR